MSRDTGSPHPGCGDIIEFLLNSNAVEMANATALLQNLDFTRWRGRANATIRDSEAAGKWEEKLEELADPHTTLGRALQDRANQLAHIKRNYWCDERKLLYCRKCSFEVSACICYTLAFDRWSEKLKTIPDIPALVGDLPEPTRTQYHLRTVKNCSYLMLVSELSVLTAVYEGAGQFALHHDSAISVASPDATESLDKSALVKLLCQAEGEGDTAVYAYRRYNDDNHYNSRKGVDVFSMLKAFQKKSGRRAVFSKHAVGKTIVSHS